MGIKHEVFEITSNLLLKGFGLDRATKWACRLNEKISPIYTVSRQGVDYHLSCPNELSRYRAKTYFTKEPETIEWMETFSSQDTMIDIGANVGLYTIFAAKKGLRVFAFEPESQNYALINRNIFLNQVSDKVTCLNVALSDKTGIDQLFIPTFMAGGALNNLGEAVDYNHEMFTAEFKQSVMVYRLDDFLEQYPDAFPTHIKIDVDGIESKVIDGARRTLKDPRLKSILIELNDALPGDHEVRNIIEQSGLRFLHKKSSAIGHVEGLAPTLNYVFVRR